MIVLAGCTGGSSHPPTVSSSTAPTTPAALPVSTIGASPRAPGYACAPNAATEAITGADGSASAIGWTGNAQGVVTCLGGWFYVQGRYERAFGFGIYDGAPTTWADAEGYLPAQITTFERQGAHVVITEFADRVTIDGGAFVAVYARVAITNTSRGELVADPFPSAGLAPLTTGTDQLAPGASATHDYVLVVDRFGATYPWPTVPDVVAAGGFDQHYSHMRAYWESELDGIATVAVPDTALNDAYRAGFIYTHIARSGTHVDTGVNNYAAEFSHDVIGILANQFTQGDFEDAHALLLDARDVVGAPVGQYEDGLWTYPWPWAVYLLKTGDLAFVKANFATSGPSGSASEPSIEQAVHHVASDRTGPFGIIGRTDDIDSDGLWTVDDYEALAGLAAYRWLAGQVGDTIEEQWATAQYDGLLAATNAVLTATISHYGLDYLPCSMVQPNTANRCDNPQDANWAAPFLFGRWAWDAPLFGAAVSGPGVTLIDATYAYGFGRLRGMLPPDTYGGYPGDYYTTGYDAGYGSWGLAGARYRTQGILGYEFMIANAQAGPYSWWESSSAPSPTSPWIGNHPATGQGSSPHAWGMANANKVLLDSLVAEQAGGTLLVGRGVPSSWLAPGRTISVTNFPTEDGQRVGITITSDGSAVTLNLSGEVPPTVRFQLPAFVGDIASSSAGVVDDAAGDVEISTPVRSVTVRLVRPNTG